MVKSPQLTTRGFQMRPRGLADIQVWGKDETKIDLSVRPEFQRAYVVEGHPEREVRDLFTDTVFTFFENVRDLTIEVRPGVLIVYRHNALVSVRHLDEFIEMGTLALKAFYPDASASPEQASPKAGDLA